MCAINVLIGLEKDISINEKLEYYLSPRHLNGEIFNVEEIKKLKNNFLQGKRGIEEATMLWFLLMYQTWKERWLD